MAVIVNLSSFALGNGTISKPNALRYCAPSAAERDAGNRAEIDAANLNASVCETRAQVVRAGRRIEGERERAALSDADHAGGSEQVRAPRSRGRMAEPQRIDGPVPSIEDLDAARGRLRGRGREERQQERERGDCKATAVHPLPVPRSSSAGPAAGAWDDRGGAVPGLAKR